jgi:hypothetical protein
MKTAMQELMEWLDDSIPETIKEKYLEKEKEQIIQAHGLKYYDIGEVTITGENYYNQNYNQNKI